ncbi:hypothetical protein IHE44_0006313 [Lamprotornis superbus]|uniref:BHLH domain-containing protein n=1 Tax=Lamprotornis superbus TaxID=245042 RepID=A0A835U0H9_9PASS|nr:hypothetical protein IHE44_0006313 [Lamprotornis superbus]
MVSEHPPKKGYDFDTVNEQTCQTYQFGAARGGGGACGRLSIDASLTKLFECMSLAYSTSVPKAAEPCSIVQYSLHPKGAAGHGQGSQLHHLPVLLLLGIILLVQFIPYLCICFLVHTRTLQFIFKEDKEKKKSRAGNKSSAAWHLLLCYCQSCGDYLSVRAVVVSARQERNGEPNIIGISFLLFSVTSLENRIGRLVSPKWKNFKGLKLQWRDKIRLNNAIWRAWYMQYLEKRKNPVCHFVTPLDGSVDVDEHRRPEAIATEGKYWKRRIEIVIREYHKWRTYFKKRLQKHKDEDLSSLVRDDDVVLWQKRRYGRETPVPMEEGSLLDADMLMSEFTDTLFSTLSSHQLVSWPNSRDIGHLGNADMIQPGLIPLQPNFDFMDTFEPFQELFTPSRSSNYFPSVSAVSSATTDSSSHSSQSPVLPSGSLPSTLPAENISDGLIPSSVPAPVIPDVVADQCSSIRSEGSFIQPADFPPDSSLSGPQTFMSVFQPPLPLLQPTSGQQQSPLPAVPLSSSPSPAPAAFAAPETAKFLCESSVITHTASATLTHNAPATTFSQSQSQGLVLATQQPGAGVPCNLAFQTAVVQGQQPRPQLQSQLTFALPKPVPLATAGTRPKQSQKIVPAPKLETVSLLVKNAFITPAAFQGQSRAVIVTPAPLKREGILTPATSQSNVAIAPAGIVRKLEGAQGAHLSTAILKNMPWAPGVTEFRSNILVGPAQRAPSSQQSQSTVSHLFPPSVVQDVLVKGEHIPSHCCSSQVPSPTPSKLESCKLSLPCTWKCVCWSVPWAGSGGKCLEVSPSCPRPLETNRGAQQDNGITACASNIPLLKYVFVKGLLHLAIQDVSCRECQNSGQASPCTSEQSPSPQSPQSSCSGKPATDPTMAAFKNRRMKHLSEQKRRFNIKIGFSALNSLVSANSKLISHAITLQKTVEYIAKLQQERAQMQEETRRLREEIEELNATILSCQQQLPATGVPVTRQRFDHMRKLFDDYVRSRTLQNWKFWIFSIIIKPLFESFNGMVSTTSFKDLNDTALAWLDQHCSLPVLRPMVLNTLWHLSRSTSILSDPSRLPDQAREAVAKGWRTHQALPAQAPPVSALYKGFSPSPETLFRALALPCSEVQVMQRCQNVWVPLQCCAVLLSHEKKNTKLSVNPVHRGMCCSRGKNTSDFMKQNVLFILFSGIQFHVFYLNKAISNHTDLQSVLCFFVFFLLLLFAFCLKNLKGFARPDLYGKLMFSMKYKTLDLTYNLKFVAHVKTCVPVTEATKFQVSAKEWCAKS